MRLMLAELACSCNVARCYLLCCPGVRIWRWHEAAGLVDVACVCVCIIYLTPHFLSMLASAVPQPGVSARKVGVSCSLCHVETHYLLTMSVMPVTHV